MKTKTVEVAKCQLCKHPMSEHSGVGCEHINDIPHPIHGFICGCMIGPPKHHGTYYCGWFDKK